jgi:hypothetical protein
MRTTTLLFNSIAACVYSQVAAAAEHQRISVVAAYVPAHTARCILGYTVVPRLLLPRDSSPERNSAESDLNFFIMQCRRRVFAQRLFFKRVHPLLKRFLSDTREFPFGATLSDAPHSETNQHHQDEPGHRSPHLSVLA